MLIPLFLDSSALEGSTLNEELGFTAESEENVLCVTEEAKEDLAVEVAHEAPELMASISSAEDLSEAVNMDEVEFLNDVEGDESDDENWDLGVEAPAYPASLASSISSLIDQQAASSSLAFLRGDNHSLVKPDLLEEANRIEELDQYDYSSVSNPDLPPDLNIGAIMRERAYVHTPNQRLNLQLSYFLAFALAAVFGFALGNLIGMCYSDSLNQNYNLFEEIVFSGLADNFPSRCASMKANSNTSQQSSGTPKSYADLSEV